MHASRGYLHERWWERCSFTPLWSISHGISGETNNHYRSNSIIKKVSSRGAIMNSKMRFFFQGTVAVCDVRQTSKQLRLNLPVTLLHVVAKADITAGNTNTPALLLPVVFLERHTFCHS